METAKAAEEPQIELNLLSPELLKTWPFVPKNGLFVDHIESIWSMYKPKQLLTGGDNKIIMIHIKAMWPPYDPFMNQGPKNA